MRKSIRHLAIGLILLTSAWTATAQTPPGAPPAPARRPFAKPDTPRQTERIREVDIKHIKAELTLDLGKKEVRGTVTHTPDPAPSLPDQDRARLRAEAQGLPGHGRPAARPRASSRTRERSSRSRSTSLTGPTTPSTWRSRYAGIARVGPAFRDPGPGLSREAAGHLDAGRGRGQPPLAPLLRLSQRPRHDRDDHHRRQAALALSPTASWSRPGRTPTAPGPSTGRWTSRTPPT